MKHEDDKKPSEYKKPKKVSEPLWKNLPELPSKHSMMLIEGTPSKLAKGRCDTRPKRRLLKG